MKQYFMINHRYQSYGDDSLLIPIIKRISKPKYAWSIRAMVDHCRIVHHISPKITRSKYHELASNPNLKSIDLVTISEEEN